MNPALILFDIDGTLLLSGRAGLRAMTRAFEQTFGITDAFKGENFGGRTDSFLVSKALQNAGLPDTAEQHQRFRGHYIPMLAEEIQQPGTGHKGLMPGARELLEALHDFDELHLALLTGNYREAAEIKLSHFGLAEYFRWGTFGEESANRDDLGRIAMTRARQRCVPSAALERAVVLGDTPHDIACARAAGLRMLAVATGFYSVDELKAAGADVALPDLTETARVMEMLR